MIYMNYKVKILEFNKSWNRNFSIIESKLKF